MLTAENDCIRGGIGLWCGMNLQVSRQAGAFRFGAGNIARWVGGGLVLAWLAGTAWSGEAASARISKVLPHLVDREGRHTLAPSLYERDAYQAFLRRHPEAVSGLRFDVCWKASRELAEGLRLRVELRGSGQAEVLTLERGVQRRPWYNRWSAVLLEEETFERLGNLIAWRVSLWRGPQMIAEQRSFLW